jgi:hypothetical protein
MHPYLTSQMANQHIKDMLNQATAAERARQGRRARQARGARRHLNALPAAGRPQPRPDVAIRPA